MFIPTSGKEHLNELRYQQFDEERRAQRKGGQIICKLVTIYNATLKYIHKSLNTIALLSKHRWKPTFWMYNLGLVFNVCY